MRFRERLIFDDMIAKIQQGWCQEAQAQDASGNSVGLDNPGAVRWCIVGAMFSAARALNIQNHICLSLIRDKIKELYPDSTGPPEWWNDVPTRTKEEVLSLLRSIRYETK